MVVTSGGESQTVYNFAYTGSIQTFTAPITGKYQLEVWGAKGGNSIHRDTNENAGGYAKGNINLKSGEKLSIYVGGKGGNPSAGGWNGGGNSKGTQADSSGGGGATDIRMNGTSLTNRIIVAGGGGGNGCSAYYGGYGGGLTGGTGGSSLSYNDVASGGTQTSGGVSNPTYGIVAGELGKGGSVDKIPSSANEYASGGGGGGYYGGSCGGMSQNRGVGGGGGSSYIGGVIDGITIAGNSSMPSPTSTSTQVGNVGNGYARITILNAAPTTPPSITATAIRFAVGETVTLTSTSSTDSDGDTIYYQWQYTTDGGSSWTTIGTSTALSRTFSIPVMTAPYIQFRVRAYDQVSYSDWKTSDEFKMVYNTAPSAPTSVYLEGNPTFVTEGKYYTLNVSGASDIDGDKLSYEVTTLVDGDKHRVTTHEELPIKVLIPDEEDVGTSLETVQFSVKAFDGKEYSAAKTSATYMANTRATILETGLNTLVEVNEGETVTISGTATDSDENQVVMVYYKVNDGLEQVITSGMSGAGINFSKLLTFKENAIFDGEKKIASKVVADGVLGAVKFEIFARDTNGAQSDSLIREITMRPNQNPTVTADKSEIALEEGSAETIAITLADVDEDKLQYKVSLRGHKSTSISLEETGTVTASFQLSSLNSTISAGDTKLNTEKLPTGTYYIDITAVDEHGAESTPHVITVTYTANRKPLLTVEDTPKIIVVTDGEYTFRGTVSDLDAYDSDKLTLGYRENGGEIINIPFNEDGTWEYVYKFDDSDVEVKTLVFIANDQKEVTSITKEFEIVDEKILFTFKEPVETDLLATKAQILVGSSLSDDAELKVWICNNGFDESPTWEEATESIATGNPHVFSNKEHTNEKVGINIKVEIMKNNAPTIYIDRIGILFE